jgi:outer membrane protein
MKAVQTLRAALLGVSLLTGAVVVATPSTASAAVPGLGKVAMVDMQRVLNETKAGKKARKDLESSSKAKQSKLDKKRQKLEADAAKLQSMSGQQLQQAQEKLQQQSMELQSMLYALEQELGQQHNKLLEKMYKNAQSIVADIAKKDGIDLVLVRDQMTVIYTKDSLDITSEVVKIYDQKHK